MTDELTDDVLAELREALERERAEISNKSKRALEEIRAEKSGGSDSIDESTEEQGTASLLRLKDREKKYLTKINQALERMEDGTYGECLECGEPIPVKRLRARPAAIFCIECKEERERQDEQRKTRPGLMDDFGM